MTDDQTRRDGMPEEEIDADRTIGGGVLSEGGTAIDRGTGTLSGTAQGQVDEDEADEADDAGAAGSAALDLSEPDFGAEAADRALGHDD